MGGSLWGNERCHILRKKPYGKTDRQHIITKRQFIEQRTAVMKTGSRIGDRDADTIVGENRRQAIVSLVERRTDFTPIREVERGAPRAVAQAITEVFKPLRKRVSTITPDQRREFAGYAEVSKQLLAQLAAFQFAHSYATWERGANENTK